MAQLLDGAALAHTMRGEVAAEVARLRETRGVTPGLAVVLVGDNPASAIYVRNKEKACAEAGMLGQSFRLPASATQAEVIELVERLNRDSRFHGILVQLPLPEQVSEEAVVNALNPAKDVDCLHPCNVGKLVQGNPDFLPCTPGGIQQLLLRNGHDPAGQHVVVCGRSNIVGKPVAILLLQRAAGANATVTVCHTRTRNLADFTRQADILIAAIGKPRAITADMVKEGAVVVDVGINRIADPTRKSGSRVVGDVDFDAVAQKAAAITPVPGGVGPMTIAMLLLNTLTAARLSLTRS